MELEIELKEQGKISRLTNKTFKFDPKLGEGFYSANYFLKSRKIVQENVKNDRIELNYSIHFKEGNLWISSIQIVVLCHTNHLNIFINCFLLIYNF